MGRGDGENVGFRRMRIAIFLKGLEGREGVGMREVGMGSGMLGVGCFRGEVNKLSFELKVLARNSVFSEEPGF